MTTKYLLIGSNMKYILIILALSLSACSTMRPNDAQIMSDAISECKYAELSKYTETQSQETTSSIVEECFTAIDNAM